MKKLRLSALSMLPLFAIFLLASCKDGDIVEPPATADEAVSGFFMVDENTPISAAKLEITDMAGNLRYTGITKEDGNFTIEKENVPQDADKYVVTFSKDAKVIQQVKLNTLVEVSKASAGKGNVFLEDEYEYNLEWPIKIVDKATKEPIEGAVFRLWTTRDGNGTMHEYTTDAEGKATLKVIEDYWYGKTSLSKEGYIGHNSNSGFCVDRYDLAQINIVPPSEMEPIFEPDGTTNNSVVVFVRKLVASSQTGPPAGGEPLCARKVIIKGPNGFIDSAYTGMYDYAGTGQEYGKRAGEVTFTGLKSGLYTISHEAVVGEYEKAEAQIQLAGDKQGYVSLDNYLYWDKLCKDNVFIVKLKDENGQPITGGTARVNSIVKDMYGNGVTISEDGTATFTGVPQGEEIFQIWAETATKIYKKAITKAVIFRCGETVTIEQTLELDRECDETACNYQYNIGINEYIKRDPSYPYPNPPTMENLGGVKIVITGPNGFVHSEVTDRKKDGRIFLENLCPGEYTATLESDEYEPASANFSINCWGGGTFDGANWKAYKKK